MNLVITIGRQHGSGGGEIGRALAESLDLAFYDKERLREYAVEQGLGKALLESYGEKHASSLLLSLATSSYSFGYFDPAGGSAISQKAYLAAFETVREVARRSPCVIVGRCADHVLRDHPCCLHVFVHAPEAFRAETVAARKGITATEALEEIRARDRLRECYYHYYTGKQWGVANSYHLTLDSSLLGIEGSAALIRQAVCACAKGADAGHSGFSAG